MCSLPRGCRTTIQTRRRPRTRSTHRPTLWCERFVCCQAHARAAGALLCVCLSVVCASWRLAGLARDTCTAALEIALTQAAARLSVRARARGRGRECARRAAGLADARATSAVARADAGQADWRGDAQERHGEARRTTSDSAWCVIAHRLRARTAHTRAHTQLYRDSLLASAPLAFHAPNYVPPRVPILSYMLR